MKKASIETRSSIPIRLQLSQILRVEIENGRFGAGARIPSERDLAERFGISRASVRESITELIQDGVLFRTIGKGTFVSEAVQKPAIVAHALPRTESASPREGICFAISEGLFHFVQTGYNRILRGVETACSEAKMRLFFLSATEGAAATWDSGSMPPLGCIVVGGVGRHLLDRLREKGIPYILVDLLIPEDSGDHMAVSIDYRSGTRAAMDHLFELGHRTFGFIGFAGSEKYKAYWQSLQHYGLAYDPRHVEFLSTLDLQPGIVAGYQAMKRMIAEGALPSSVLVVNDFAALGALEQLQIAGISVPGNISVVGYDDLGHSARPALTTVRVDLHQVGRLAAEVLFRKLNGEPMQDQEYIVPVDLVVRGSTSSVRAAKAS